MQCPPTPIPGLSSAASLSELITLRSDGANLEISFRLEKPRGKQLWQTYSMRHDLNHGWVLTDTDDH